MEYRARDSNLYRYVGNSPLRRTDPTGLAGCCGKEIGHLLDTFSLNAHRAFFRKLYSDPSNALLACAGKDNVAGWDILDLLNKSKYQFSKDGCGTQECRGTVMVHDQCHWASDVNYFLWGLANHLCASAIWRDSNGNPTVVGSQWWTEEFAVDLAAFWAGLTGWYGDGTIAGRVAWTRAGYHGNTTVPSIGAASKCHSCGQKATSPFQGHFGRWLNPDAHVFIP